jgi:hypothetical protein
LQIKTLSLNNQTLQHLSPDDLLYKFQQTDLGRNVLMKSTPSTFRDRISAIQR